MPLSHPLLVRFVLAIVFPLVLLLGAASAYFWRSLPVANEQRALQGITAVINVTRDSQEVPRIAAETGWCPQKWCMRSDSRGAGSPIS